MQKDHPIPKITIITPSFNQGEYLEETILSVLNQNYPNLEYIIIDGGSTDNSVEIIKKYSASLKFWISEKDRGQSDAIKKGFQHSTGDWVNWLNSDDVLKEGALFELANAVIRYENQYLVHSFNCDVVNEKGKYEDTLLSKAPKGFESFLIPNKMVIPQPSTFVNSKVFQIDEDLHYVMDWALYIKIILNNPKSFLAHNITIANFRNQPLSKTNTNSKQFVLEAFDFISQVETKTLKQFFLVKLWLRNQSFMFELGKKMKSNGSILGLIVYYPEKLFSRFFLGALKQKYLCRK
jgi:glycosyltransferase involved in cell wall biosynthesis